MSHFSRLPSDFRINAPFLVPTSTRTPLIGFFLRFVEYLFARSLFLSLERRSARAVQDKLEKKNKTAAISRSSEEKKAPALGRPVQVKKLSGELRADAFVFVLEKYICVIPGL